MSVVLIENKVTGADLQKAGEDYGKFIKIVVKDTGIGIPGEELTKLFSKFHRVQDKKTIEVRGTGLGLWITKQIVEILGGRIGVESIYGTGTSVIITLPVGSSS